MAQIVDADIRDFGLQAHSVPESLQVYNRLPGNIAGKQKGAALRHGIAAQAYQGDGLVGDWHAVDTALFGVGGLLRPDCQSALNIDHLTAFNIDQFGR